MGAASVSAALTHLLVCVKQHSVEPHVTEVGLRGLVLGMKFGFFVICEATSEKLVEFPRT